MFVIFNHTLTKAQQTDAATSLGVGRFVCLPPALASLWSQLPPEAATLTEVLSPLFQWLSGQACPGDFVLVQGDFGATFLVAQYAQAHNLVPLYSTTRREAVEELAGDEVRLSHHFRHVRFRQYEAWA